MVFMINRAAVVVSFLKMVPMDDLLQPPLKCGKTHILRDVYPNAL